MSDVSDNWDVYWKDLPYLQQNAESWLGVMKSEASASANVAALGALTSSVVHNSDDTASYFKHVSRFKGSVLPTKETLEDKIPWPAFETRREKRRDEEADAALHRRAEALRYGGVPQASQEDQESDEDYLEIGGKVIYPKRSEDEDLGPGPVASVIPPKNPRLKKSVPTDMPISTMVESEVLLPYTDGPLIEPEDEPMYEIVKHHLANTIREQMQQLLLAELRQEGLAEEEIVAEAERIGPMVLDSRSKRLTLDDTFGFMKQILATTLCLATRDPDLGGPVSNKPMATRKFLAPTAMLMMDCDPEVYRLTMKRAEAILPHIRWAGAQLSKKSNSERKEREVEAMAARCAPNDSDAGSGDEMSHEFDPPGPNSAPYGLDFGSDAGSDSESSFEFPNDGDD